MSANIAESRQDSGKMNLCLDVGCGDNPHPDADILCDLHVGKPKDRAFVVSDASHLPFRDKTFSRVNCVVVMEHVENPRLLLSELRRVAEHGYVETPSRFLENVLVGWKDHKWVIVRHGNRLDTQRPKRLCLGWVRLRSFDSFGRSEDEFMFPFGLFTRPLAARFLLKERVFKGRAKSRFPPLFTRYSF